MPIRAPRYTQKRALSFLRNVLGMDAPAAPDAPSVANRFHPWETSPSPDLRTRAATIKTHARCPVTHKDIAYTCPILGIPTHHSRQAWENDTEYHETKRYEQLKWANVLEHDLRSGREFPELNFAGEQEFDRAVNFSNWDAFLYTRLFPSVDTEFQMAAVSKMLSYPVTIGLILHQYLPYLRAPKGPITLEGLKSLAALRYSLYPPNLLTSSLKDRPMRIFIVGAATEGRLPAHVWKQLGYLFQGTLLDLHFIGPESYFTPEKGVETSTTTISKRVDPELGMYFHTDFFHVYHDYQDFFPYDPYLDVFFVFHPGFSAALMTWTRLVEALLETKCGVFISGCSEKETQADYNWLKENFDDKMDVLMEPTENIFGSTKWEVNDFNPQDVYQYNQQLFGVRGKRYHIVH